jgi:hypothetical protein
MPVIVRRHFRRVILELVIMAGVFVFAFASAVFAESLFEPQWHGRARWSSWPAVLLLPWPMIRLVRLLFSRWAIRIDGDRIETRASMWRDFSYRFAEVRQVVTRDLGSGRLLSNYTIVALLDGRRHWVFDRYLDMPDDFDLVATLKGDNSDTTR